MPPIPPLTEALTDGAIELRPISDWDIPEILIAHQDDPGLHRALGEARAPSGAELGREVERSEAERAAGTRLALTIVEPDSDDCRGRVELTDLDWSDGRAEVRVWVVPERRGRGYARRALLLLAAWTFDHTDLDRLVAAVAPQDGAAVTAARAAGFIVDGSSGATHTLVRRRDDPVSAAEARDDG